MARASMVFTAALLLLNVQNATANTCHNEASEGIRRCQTRVNGARLTNVSSVNTDGGQAVYGRANIQAAEAVIGALNLAKQNCLETDLNYCVDQCNRALGAATSQEMADQIKANMNACSQGIDASVASADASIQGLNQYAANSANTHNAACQGDCAIERDPARVQKVSANADLPMKVQLFNTPSGTGEVDSTFGQYKVFKKMYEGTPLKVYPAGPVAPRTK